MKRNHCPPKWTPHNEKPILQSFASSLLWFYSFCTHFHEMTKMCLKLINTPIQLSVCVCCVVKCKFNYPSQHDPATNRTNLSTNTSREPAKLYVSSCWRTMKKGTYFGTRTRSSKSIIVENLSEYLPYINFYSRNVWQWNMVRAIESTTTTTKLTKFVSGVMGNLLCYSW